MYVVTFWAVVDHWLFIEAFQFNIYGHQAWGGLIMYWGLQKQRSPEFRSPEAGNSLGTGSLLYQPSLKVSSSLLCQLN